MSKSAVSANANTLVSATEVYKSRQYLLDILQSQGYITDEYSGFSLNEINVLMSNNQLDMLIEKADKSRRIYVRYSIDKLLNRQVIDKLVSELFGDRLEGEDVSPPLQRSTDAILVILRSPPSDTVMSYLEYLWDTTSPPVFISAICIEALQFNILKHTLVPKHRILSPEEVREVMARYNIREQSHFPRISRFDPVALVLLMRPGEVAHILRPSKTAILADYYRTCDNIH